MSGAAPPFAFFSLALPLLLLAACKDDPPSGAKTASMASIGPSERCVVHLHGKSGRGRAPHVRDGVAHLYPDGNAPGWGGLQWLYFPEAKYEEVRSTVSQAIGAAECQRVIVAGFSNGAAAAAKLRCRNERFGGRVIGYVVDDPVPDHGVDGCAPSRDLKVQLYWTGGLASAVAGWDCAAADWTCEGGSTIGIEKYARALAVPVTPSVHKEHKEYESPPELGAWW